MVVTPAHFIALSVILFVIGAVGMLVRRNAIVVLQPSTVFHRYVHCGGVQFL